jgi:putative tricarboxylic transport membrane protein
MNSARVRRPGEAAFAVILAIFSAFLLWTAYNISGFEALSSPGALPMAAAGTMFVCAAMIAVQTLRSKAATDESLTRDIVPMPIILTIVMVGAYALLLQPLGFLPTSFLFVTILIRVLGRQSLAFCAAVSAVSILLIYLVFRIIFNVIMPEGIVPEREILAAIGRLFAGGK